MKKYRVGIVGVGKIAQTYFSVFQRMKTVEVVFLCDIVPEQMTKAVRAFPELLKNALQTDSTDKIFDAGVKVDSVVVATPLSSHFFLAQRVLRRGVCVFLEKPATPTVRELEELYALADANGTHFRTMFHYAYSPEVFHFSQLFPKWSETLGPLRAFVCDFLDAAVSGNRLVISPRKQGGSCLSSGVNALSVAAQCMRLEGLRMQSRICRQVPDLIDRNEERVVPEVDTASVTEYFDPERQLFGVIRTDWEQGVNFKSTQLFYQNGEVLLDHEAQSVHWTFWDAQIHFPSASFRSSVSPMERHYEVMFPELFFRAAWGPEVQENDLWIHRQLFEDVS